MTSVFDNLWLSDLAPEIKRPKKKVAAAKAEIPQLAYPSPACDEAEFLRTIGDHRMVVLFDNGLMRHLRFFGGSYNRWFEIITWAGKLAISGDMGTFVFSRVEDMFTFFRGEQEGPLKINPGYWAEKCIAQDRHGLRTFNPDYFKARIHEWLQDSDISTGCWEEIQAEVLSQADEGEWFAMQSAIEFRSEDGFVFQDFWEADCKVYTYHYLWCLYAIVWGIRQYDAMKEARQDGTL